MQRRQIYGRNVDLDNFMGAMQTKEARQLYSSNAD